MIEKNFPVQQEEWIKLTEMPAKSGQEQARRAYIKGVFEKERLRTSVDSEVQDHDGRAIAGLYAAGACAWNLAQDTRSYSSGTCLGESTYFGRRAGRHAARH